MNKLRFDGPWANRPRDVANLARLGAKELERQLNWQVVPITRDWTDWTDSPILYVSSHIPLKFTDEQVTKVRKFVQAGGLLYTQADGSGIPATRSFEDLAKKLFPDYEMQDLPDDHEIYSIHFKPSPRPRLRYVTNGVRVLMVHSSADLSQHWQLRQEKTKRNLYEFGINLFLYASGKADLKNRLASPVIPAQAAPGGGRLKVARVKYAGAWDPEPMAWERMARYFQRETDVAADVTAIDMDQLDSAAASGAGVAHWTGAAAHTATGREIAAARKFVEGGGVLLVDSAGGGGEFAESARAARAAIAPGAKVGSVSVDHPIMTGGGQTGTEDLSRIVVRPFVRARGGASNAGRLEIVRLGKGAILFSSLDLTHGLLGASTWGIWGYDPAYASALVKNILIWQAMGIKD
ncbi:MAG TPA: DUF4159 domain-containing protein [Tepidisphaeraceae bacterium]|nr:DUF4159 domain-containing protein [Tepidisphaeraceae bacterium]